MDDEIYENGMNPTETTAMAKEVLNLNDPTEMKLKPPDELSAHAANLRRRLASSKEMMQSLPKHSQLPMNVRFPMETFHVLFYNSIVMNRDS